MEPAICGLAIDVPLSIAQSRDSAASASNGCSSAKAANISTPGALIPGDKLPSYVALGPREEKSASTSPLLASIVRVMVVAEMEALCVAPPSASQSYSAWPSHECS